MKILRMLALAGVSVVTLAGCGDGGVQSPDFTPVLQGLSLTTTADTDDSFTPPPMEPDRYFLPLGIPGDLTVSGLCTTPPDSDSTSQPCGVTDVSFVIEAVGGSGAGTVENGQLTGTEPGIIEVTATSDDLVSETLVFRIGPAIVTAVDITPDNPPPPAVGEGVTFTATGTFSNGVEDDVNVDWTIVDEDGNQVDPTTGAVTFQQGPGNTTTITPQPGSEGQTYTLVGTITADDGNGNEIVESDQVTFTVSNEVLVEVLRIEPQNDTVGAGATKNFTAIGRYTGGTAPREGTIPADQLTWTSSDTASVTIDANTGVATGQAPGTDSTITGTLRAGVAPGATIRSASTTLTVLTLGCSSPLLQSQGATATAPPPSGACIGCSVTNPVNVIDASPLTFATISAPLGLLGGTVSLDIDAAPGFASFPLGSTASLIVAKPAGLLSVELLSALSISTRLNGAPTGEGSSDTTPLAITALGAIGGQDAALISFPTTQAFDGLSLTFNVGAVSLLPTVNVFQACGVTTP